LARLAATDFLVASSLARAAGDWKRSLSALVVLAVAACACLHASAGKAAEVYYIANLSGAAAAPPNASQGIGTALVWIDTDFSTLHMDVFFNRLSGTVTSAHIQGLTAEPGTGLADSATGLPTLSGFASGVTFGFYHGIFDLNSESTYNPAFIAEHGGAAAEAMAALRAGLDAGRTYFNIRTTSVEDGEVRGFFAANPLADFDRDGRVGGADLSVWRFSFASANFADADGDGDSDGADFLQWQRDLGKEASIPQLQSAAAGNAVPEPATFTMFGLWALGLSVARRHRV
jgi:hypothetical protein